MIAIRNGYLLTLDEKNQLFPKGDLVIKDCNIEYVGPRLEHVPEEATVLDGTGKLVMPGLVNVHAHTNEILNRGRFDNMILEAWALYAYPTAEYGPFSPRLIYLRTMLAAIEMLRGGVTCVQDDVVEAPRLTMEGASAVRQAYIDSGMRASVACPQVDRRHFEQYPSLRDRLPPSALGRMMASAPPNFEENLAIYAKIIDRWHDVAGGRLRVTLSFLSPQRCTPQYMLELLRLANERDLPLHMHILETKTQRVNSQVLFGKSPVEYVDGLGLLSPRTTIVHSVWVDAEDIELLGRAGVNVAHCPVANLKLGDGVMPLRPLVGAGVTVGLGTDGPSSNDSMSLFATMKLAAILHKNSGRDPAEWPTAREVLRMATVNGARSMLLDGKIGRLASGFKADIVLLDTETPSFTPLNDPVNQLVYCENGSSVDTVIVDGRIVMRGGVFECVDDKGLMRELREMRMAYTEQFERASRVSDELLPSYRDHAGQRLAREIPMSRWFTDRG
jgi:cytosine/adenosine deaminase-related metal-dependent hydrolase